MLLLDTLRVANWQRSVDGSKGRNRPRPVSPLVRAAGETTYGGAKRAPATSRAQALALLDRIGPQAPTPE
jgi:hypothetical protein